MTQNVTSEAPLTPVSWGELIDKVTILEIKKTQMSDADAIFNVCRELAALSEIVKRAIDSQPRLQNLKELLFAVNRQLWDIEDAIRQKESTKSFDAGFIELARSVYKTNDQRAALKREINFLVNSPLIEEKSYKSY
jgi:hypothetical protein